MSDYTRVLKGLRHCINLGGLEPNDTRIRCHECPYFTEPTRCGGILMRDAAAAIEELMAFDIRQLPEGLYTVKNGVVYTARVKVSGGNVLNLKTGESHWEDDRIVGGEQVFPKLPKEDA